MTDPRENEHAHAADADPFAEPPASPEPIVDWQPSRRLGDRMASALGPAGQPAGRMAIGALALGALAMGAFAVGALAIGTLAIGRLAVGGARVRTLRIDHLIVGRIDHL